MPCTTVTVTAPSGGDTGDTGGTGDTGDTGGTGDTGTGDTGTGGFLSELPFEVDQKTMMMAGGGIAAAVTLPKLLGRGSSRQQYNYQPRREPQDTLPEFMQSNGEK